MLPLLSQKAGSILLSILPCSYHSMMRRALFKFREPTLLRTAYFDSALLLFDSATYYLHTQVYSYVTSCSL